MQPPTILSPENWFFDLDFLPQPAYMVGGAVRDALLGRTREYLDLDFIVSSDAIKVARNIARHYKAGFVILDSERKIARVVFDSGTADFAQQEGSLENDLRRRDFTVNAIAYNPYTQEIIDPLGGCTDLEKGLLKMISPHNLQDDPLRLLRGYRQAGQLSFTIEPNTQNAIRSLASHITTVAAERVRAELSYMLLSKSTVWIKNAWEDNLLAPFFKYATPESFIKLAAVETLFTKLTETWQELGGILQEYVRSTVKTTWLGIAKLACIVNPQPEAAENELLQLTYSRAEARAVSTALKLFPQLQTQQMPLREQYFFFQQAGFVFPATAILAIIHNNQVEAVAPMIRRYLNPDDLVAHPTPLLSGEDIIIALKIKASPLIGKLLTEIGVAQVEGRICTKDQAIALAKQLVELETFYTLGG
jgi:tRNA nucleotidyltransferase (CCA-adding enzyme)